MLAIRILNGLDILLLFQAPTLLYAKICGCDQSSKNVGTIAMAVESKPRQWYSLVAILLSLSSKILLNWRWFMLKMLRKFQAEK